jgi:hypothetical protein
MRFAMRPFSDRDVFAGNRIKYIMLARICAIRVENFGQSRFTTSSSSSNSFFGLEPFFFGANFQLV